MCFNRSPISAVVRKKNKQATSLVKKVPSQHPILTKQHPIQAPFFRVVCPCFYFSSLLFLLVYLRDFFLHTVPQLSWPIVARWSTKPASSFADKDPLFPFPSFFASVREIRSKRSQGGRKNAIRARALKDKSSSLVRSFHACKLELFSNLQARKDSL